MTSLAFLKSVNAEQVALTSPDRTCTVHSQPAMEPLPFIRSRYFGRDIFINQLPDLSDHELALLANEVHGIETDAARFIEEQRRKGTNYTHTGAYGKLVRMAGRFVHAIDGEQIRRRQQSVLSVLAELKAVKAERDALKEVLMRRG